MKDNRKRQHNRNTKIWKPQIEAKSSKTNTITADEINTHRSDNYSYYDSELAKQKYWLDSLESKRLDMQTSDLFESMNKSYRVGTPDPMWNYLSNALKKLPSFEWKVFRWEQYTLDEYNKVYWGLKKWDVIKNKAFTSTSTDRGIAEEFAWFEWWKLKNPAEKNVIITIESKNWKYVLNSAEKEIMFDAWTDYEVLGINDDWNIVELYLKEL